MCYNCGCQMPDDDMGQPDNIINKTFAHHHDHDGEHDHVHDETAEKVKVRDSLKQGQIPPDWQETFEKAAAASDQSLEEAKKNTLDLLQKTTK